MTRVYLVLVQATCVQPQIQTGIVNDTQTYSAAAAAAAVDDAVVGENGYHGDNDEDEEDEDVK